MPRHKLLFTACIAVAAASLWLRSAFPVFALGQAVHDDFLFVRLAYALGAGQWLGPYDNLTLAKGMGYPAFILAAFVAGIPLKIAEHVLYLAAAGLAAWLVARLAGHRWLGFALFAVLAFNPIFWHWGLARVIREGIYVSLSFAVLMLAAALLLPPRGEGSHSARFRLGIAVVLGIAAAFYWLTREEGPWLVPALTVLVAWALLDLRRGGRHVGDGSRLVRAGRVFAPLGLALAVFALAAGSVATVNYIYYGALQTNEFQAASFRAAYGALARIRPAAWRPYVIFPVDAREKAYAVSAAARELRPSLEGTTGESWRRLGCQEARIDPCPEILGGWFMWALRDAVAEAGHYASAHESLAFYRRLADEITAACDDGRLSCGVPGVSVFPPFRWQYVGEALALSPAAYDLLVHLGNAEVGTPASIGPHFAIEYVAALVGPVSSAPTPTITLTGTAAAAGEAPRISVRDAGGTRFTMQLRPLDSAAARPQPSGKVVNEFELETDCLRPTCRLVVTSGAGERSFPIAALLQDDVSAAGDIDVSLTRVGKRAGTAGPRIAVEKLRRAQLAIARPIAAAYAALVPGLTVLAAFGLLGVVTLGRRHPPHGGMLALALACAVAVATRIVLVTYFHATVLPTPVNLLYLSPAAPFLLTFILLAGYAAIGTLCALLRERGRRD